MCHPLERKEMRTACVCVLSRESVKKYKTGTKEIERNRKDREREFKLHKHVVVVVMEESQLPYLFQKR